MQNITNKNRHCIKLPITETQRAECIFQMQYPICAVNFTNKISRSSWKWHIFWKTFSNKYFHNSVDWSGLYLQVYIAWWLSKILRFTDSWLLENVFVKLPCPYKDLITNPPCRTVPQYICLIRCVLPPFCCGMSRGGLKKFQCWQKGGTCACNF